MGDDGREEVLARTRVVIVADQIELRAADVGLLSFDMDKTESRHTRELAEAAARSVKEVVVYDRPEDLVDNAHLHTGDLVIPDWSGSRSWSRTGLVPAICEASGLAYVGADAYTKIVCHDKFLAKALCRHVGLDTPRGIFVDHVDKIDVLDTLTYPCVVKPCHEGSSIGIDDGSLVRTPEEGARRAAELLSALGAPVLVEEFRSGREVSLCLLGRRDGGIIHEAGERFLRADEKYFLNHVFSYDLKKDSKRTALRVVTPQVPTTIVGKAMRLFRMLQKVEVLRVDGRLDGEDFSVIELTPETHLGARAEFCGTFIQAGMDYEGVVRAILLNSLAG